MKLLWIEGGGEARAKPLRLRAARRSTGSSPLRPWFRGQLSEDGVDSYWLYDALGARIWVYRDNEYAPQRPLVFVLEVTGEELQRRRRAPAMDVVVDEPPVPQSVRTEARLLPRFRTMTPLRSPTHTAGTTWSWWPVADHCISSRHPRGARR